MGGEVEMKKKRVYRFTIYWDLEAQIFWYKKLVLKT